MLPAKTSQRRRHHSPSLLFLFVLIVQGVLSQNTEIRIQNAKDLIEFSDNVNSGTSYEGTTVLLDSDIEFTAEESNQFKPIGKEPNSFRGVFDGQGHSIKNFTINSDFKYVGLFGYSQGATIKNLVIDESCSIESYYSGSLSPFIGGVAGICNPNDNPCIFENNVNMASVTFRGSEGKHIFLGGIIGQFNHKDGQEDFIRNCANYGPITRTGQSNGYSFVGGIVGESYGKIIVNCVNYGSISINGTTEKYIIGGIVGKSWNVTIDNCLSAGKIVSVMGDFGSIVGDVGEWCITNITHSFWTNETGYANTTSSTKTNENDSSITSLSKTTFVTLNYYASEKDVNWSKWIMIHLNGGKLNNGIPSYKELIVIQKHFPEPVNDGHTFQFWCTDAGCTEKYEPSMTEVTELHAIWGMSTVTFMNDEDVILNKSLAYGSNIPYPTNPTKKGHSFVEWDSNPTTVPDNDITITAIFIPNNYTVAFDFDNGTVIEEEYQYNARIEYPLNIVRKGYVFIGWNNTLFEFMPDHNVTTKALWNETTQFVEIVFGTKDMSKDEIENVIKEYVDEDIDFVIEGFEVDKDTGETRVIIKFVDREKAENFVETIKESSDFTRGIIKKVGYINDPIGSFVIRILIPTLFMIGLQFCLI